MDAYHIALIVGTAIKWLVYTALLWFMIKIQKLNYNVAGLFASSLAATLIWYIPLVGSYLSYAVLVVCLWKCTGADIAPDVIFTVGIAGALMFCFNLWVIGMLMGNLRPDLAKANPDAETTESVEDMDEDAEDPDGDEAEVRPSTGSGQAPAQPASAPRTRTATTAATPSAVRAAARTAPQPKEATPAAFPVMEAGSLSVKGISLGAARPSVMISDGIQVHTVGRGDSFTAAMPEGRTRLRCEDITKTHVVLRNGMGQTLHIQLP